MAKRVDRWKVWKGILGGGLGVVLALVALYGWLALKPTGYAKLAQTQGEAARQIQATLVGALEPPHPATPAIPPVAPEQVTKDSYRLIDFLNNEDFQFLEDALFKKWEEPNLEQKLTLTAKDLGLDALPEPEGLVTTQRAIILSSIRSMTSSRMGSIEDKVTTGSGPARLAEALTRMEHLLLAPGVMGNYQWLTRSSVHSPSLAISRLQILGAEATLRAARRGDTAKAGAMLVALAEITRHQYLESFPTPSRDFRTIQLLLLRLAESPNFPPQSLERVAAILDRTVLSGGQRAALRFAEAQKNLEANHNGLSEPRRPSNNWHYLYDGKPERLVTEVLEPLMRNKLEEGAVALAAADAGRLVSIQKQINRLARMMNLNRPPTLTPFTRSYMNDNGSWDDDRKVWDELISDRYYADLAATYGRVTREGRFNDEVNKTRILLALVRFRLATGRMPEKIGELAPRYLDPGVVQADGARWALWRLPEAHGLNMKGIRTLPGNPQKIDPNDPFMRLLANYMKTVHNAWPTYKELLETAATAEERKVVEQHKGDVIPASLAVGRIRKTTLNAAEWERNERASSRPNEELMRRVMQERFGGQAEAAAFEIDWIGVRP